MAAGPTYNVNDDLYRFGLNVVGGGERRSGPLGFGVDLALLYFPAASRVIGLGEISGSAWAVPMGSVYGAYHFRRTGHGGEPFVQGGFTVPIVPDGGFAWEFAGGADWWLTPRLGIRTAVRDRVTGLPVGLLGAEGGIVFR